MNTDNNVCISWRVIEELWHNKTLQTKYTTWERTTLRSDRSVQHDALGIQKEEAVSEMSKEHARC